MGGMINSIFPTRKLCFRAQELLAWDLDHSCSLYLSSVGVTSSLKHKTMADDRTVYQLVLKWSAQRTVCVCGGGGTKERAVKDGAVERFPWGRGSQDGGHLPR